jgi:hypothetical protein
MAIPPEATETGILERVALRSYARNGLCRLVDGEGHRAGPDDGAVIADARAGRGKA